MNHKGPQRLWPLYTGVIFLTSALILQGLYGASNRTDKASKGQTIYNIDWEKYRFKVESVVEIPEKVSVNERYYMRSLLREIILRKISTGLEQMYVDNSHMIRDILDENNHFRRAYPLYLDSLKLVRLNFRNNLVEASTSLPLRGSKGLIGKLPLPWESMIYQSLQESEYIGEAYERNTALEEYRGEIIPIIYTGLIVDLRGMEINQALAPRIFSQNGRLIYGPEYINKKTGTTRGIASYVKGMSVKEVKVRAGEEPFFTVALTTKGKYKTDIVLSNEDTAKLMQHPETLQNLLKCRVVFVVDGD